MNHYLQFQESEGVPVVTIGTNMFPAFYSQQTIDSIKSPIEVSNTKEASDLIDTHMRLGLNVGIVLAVPVPEPYSIEANQIEAALEQALDTAAVKNISGKDVTPFLLAELIRLTGGRALQTSMYITHTHTHTRARVHIYCKIIFHS
jgi:pseudouridine-5'-phosphate glycosidase